MAWCICQRDNNPAGMKMSALGHPLVFSEQWANPSTIGHAAAGPKTSSYTGKAKELPLYTEVT